MKGRGGAVGWEEEDGGVACLHFFPFSCWRGVSLVSVAELDIPAGSRASTGRLGRFLALILTLVG